MIPTLAFMRLDDPGMASFVRYWTGRADRVSAADRPASLLARALAHFLVAEAGIPSRFQIDKDAHGKPRLVAPDGGNAPSISLTHSASVVAAALSEGGPLGIDVERHKPRNFAALAAAAFGPEECTVVERGGSREFYRFWTLREAYAKATGCGVEQLLDRTDRFHSAPHTGAWIMALDGSAWRFATWWIGANYSLAVALGDVAARCCASIGPTWDPAAVIIDC